AVATVNVTKDTGAFQFVTPVASAPQGATPGAANANYVLRLKKADGTQLGEYPAPFYPDACTDPGHDQIGLIDALVPAHAEAATLELVHNGKVLASFHATAAPAAPQNVQAAQPAGAAAVAAAAAAAPSGDPVITWTPGGAGGGMAAAPAALASAAGPTY